MSDLIHSFILQWCLVRYLHFRIFFWKMDVTWENRDAEMSIDPNFQREIQHGPRSATRCQDMSKHFEPVVVKCHSQFGKGSLLKKYEQVEKFPPRFGHTHIYIYVDIFIYLFIIHTSVYIYIHLCIYIWLHIDLHYAYDACFSIWLVFNTIQLHWWSLGMSPFTSFTQLLGMDLSSKKNKQTWVRMVHFDHWFCFKKLEAWIWR